MKKDFKAIREQGNKFVTENIMHVITRTNRAECGAVCQNDRLSAGHIWQTRSHVYGEVNCQAKTQRDVVIPNKLSNGESCKGLRHWKLLSNLKNNFSKPIRNDMGRHTEDNSPKYLQTLECRFFAYAQNDAKDKTVTNLFPYFPISLSLKKKVAFTLAEGATHVDLPLTKVKFAFTLAEVLITLGIIGIVAAMTIPNLMSEHRKRVTVTKLKKSISIVNQAYRLSIADQGQPQIDDALTMDLEDYFKKYWAPYIKYSTYCRTYDICGYSSKLPFKTLAGNNWTYQLTPDANFTFETNDAMVYSIQLRGYCSKPKCEYVNGIYGTNGNMNVLIDINGSKGPNILGKDVFYLSGSLIDVIGIQPAGYSYSTDVINENCSKEGQGRYCAEMIKRAGWEIEKNYPWK